MIIFNSFFALKNAVLSSWIIILLACGRVSQLDSPVAVDGDGDDEQHGHDDSGDDDVERQIMIGLVLHRADHPLAFAELDLWINTGEGILLSAEALDSGARDSFRLESKVKIQ